MPLPPPSSLRASAVAAFAFLAGCASTPAPRAGAVSSHDVVAVAEAPAAAAAPASAASAPVPAAAPSGPAPRILTTRGGQQVLVMPVGAVAPNTPPFATVTKEARKIDGLMTMWQKDEKVWLELKPSDFGKPFFFSPKLAQGLGEPPFYGGLMTSRFAAWGAPQVVEFRKVHNLVQMVAKNTTFQAKPGTPGAYAVDAAFTDSLLGSAPVASQPGPDKAVLVEANALFLTDVLGMAIRLQHAYHQPYAYDVRNSFFDYVRGTPDELVFDVDAHYVTGTIAVPAPNLPPQLMPSLPDYVPDVRSLFLGLHYSLARLPEKPMVPRPADPRVGYFTTTVADFTDDVARTPRERYVARWRLEKQDPSAPLSPPVKPITYWLDRSIPLKYRDSIARGILEWNKAFEKIGFKDAIVVKTEPDDAAFDTLDVGHASVRWMTNASPAFGAIGPTHVDPRTGEILDADIAIESLSSRNQRAQRAQVLDLGHAFDWPALLQTSAEALLPTGSATDAAAAMAGPAARSRSVAAALFADRADPAACQAGEYGAEELGYGLDVLAARGDVAPDSPQADAWVQAYLFDVAMHEAGHTLGLRHNFRASRLYGEQEVDDPAFTRTHALSASVMDYLPVNLPAQGAPAPAPFQTTLGPYDYWAIKYAYEPLPAGQTPAQQKDALLAIAAENRDRALEYGTDEDNFLGIDPAALQFDLGSDPVVFARKRFAIAHELFQRQETRRLQPGEDYSVLRRSVTYALRDATRSAGVLLRQIGGTSTLRDFPGSGRDPMEPVPPKLQKAALETLVDGVLAPESFQVSPALQRRLAPDFLERGDASAGGDLVSTDYPVEAVMLDFQRQLLAVLMSDAMAQRLEDSAPKLDTPGQAVTPADVYGRLTRALWVDPANYGPTGRGDIPARRRELQRDYVNRLANVLLRAPAGVRVDMRASLRAEAMALQPRIQAARQRPGLSEAAKLHLADCAETLRLALAAPMQRAGY